MWVILAYVAALSAFPLGESVCYFPVEFQGVFATQSLTSVSADSNHHKYSTITILPDAIPGWGVCETKQEDAVVLHDRTGGGDCLRCFHIKLRAPNVMQVHTEMVARCYNTEAEARATCPTLLDITTNRVQEIMLYKNRSFTREGTIERVFCPISGAYDFTYNVHDGLEAAKECPQSTSTIQNCPHGSELNLKFQRCTFSDIQMSLRCLGDWTDHSGRRYLALLDTTHQKADQPRYRCAMFDKDEMTGVVHLSFSVDATCTNQLQSPHEGYETMVLTPRTVIQPPNEVKSHACIFPDWARGKWQHLEILRHDVKLHDASSDRIFEMECLSQHAPHGERYAVFSRDQCGREEFTCIWIKKRAVNVIEFQMSNYPSDHYNQSQVCADAMFVGQHWSTEGRVGVHEEPSCPIQGEHAGVLPDATDLCARLVSDCSSPQRMHYTVASCANASQVYEESPAQSPFYAVKYRRRREVYRIRDIKKYLKRHHSGESAISSATSSRFESGQSFADNKTLFDSIHALTARYLAQNNSDLAAGRSSFGSQVPAHSLVGMRLSQNARTTPSASHTDEAGSSEAKFRHSLYESIVPEYVYPGGFRVGFYETTSAPHKPATHTSKFVYPGGFVRPTPEPTTRRPLPHESPFYRVIPSSNQRDYELYHDVSEGLMEEREYRCLGRWSEGGVTYTYTHRVDVDTYECFAGVVVNKKEIYIVEAGASCLRGLQPLAHGMKLVQKATCSELRERAAATSTTTTTSTRRPPSLSNPESGVPPNSGEDELHPWWRNAARNPWPKNTLSTTHRPFSRDHRPRTSSGSSYSPPVWTWLAVTTSLLIVFSTS